MNLNNEDGSLLILALRPGKMCSGSLTYSFLSSIKAVLDKLLLSLDW
jgi:hypothetical protein